MLFGRMSFEHALFLHGSSLSQRLIDPILRFQLDSTAQSTKVTFYTFLHNVAYFCTSCTPQHILQNLLILHSLHNFVKLCTFCTTLHMFAHLVQSCTYRSTFTDFWPILNMLEYFLHIFTFCTLLHSFAQLYTFCTTFHILKTFVHYAHFCIFSHHYTFRQLSTILHILHQ